MIRTPKVNEVIYIPDKVYIGHGQDDIRGGRATVESVTVTDASIEYNKIFVTLHNLSGSYNWAYLLENQEKWSEKS